MAQALGRMEWMAGDCDGARQVWERGLEAVGPSAPLLNLWAQRELRAGGPQVRVKSVKVAYFLKYVESMKGV